jgi:hypothetical protein
MARMYWPGVDAALMLDTSLPRTSGGRVLAYSMSPRRSISSMASRFLRRLFMASRTNSMPSR